jgi:hypothetical protein
MGFVELTEPEFITFEEGQKTICNFNARNQCFCLILSTYLNSR